MERRTLLAFGAASAALAGLPGRAQAQLPRRDIDYRLIPQQPVAAGGSIEVIDFFFYGCPYCFQLHGHLEAWLARKPADVVLRRSPAVRQDTWAPLAKTWFTLEALGAAERLHGAVYRAYHLEELHMSQEPVMADWAARQGLDRDRWLEVYRSDDVRAKVERARQMTRDYRIEGTPSVVVDGRYLTSSGITDDVPRVITVLDGLVRVAREQRSRR